MIKPLQTSKGDIIVSSTYIPTPENNKQFSFGLEMDTHRASENNEDSSNTSISNTFVIQSSPENTKKENFRQRIRNLRETCEDGPLLASTEEILDAQDDSGFILASRVRKSKKLKSPKLACSPDDNSNSLVAHSISTLDVSTVPKHTFTEDDAMKLTYVPDPDIEKSKFNQLLAEVSEQTNQDLDDLSCKEVVSRINALKQKLGHREEINSEPKKEERKSPWCNKTENLEKRVLDFNECSICYQPWTEDKVILEECGHCFHSECIRLWMKRKNTCPFCATFSLLLDEFPKLA